MSFTYTGPSVSAAFVAGVFNDAWDAATAQNTVKDGKLAEAQVRFDDAIEHIDSLVTQNSVSNPKKWAVSIQAERDYTPDLNPEGDNSDLIADGLRQHLQDQLKDMLQSFITKFYPFYQIPDGSDAWERVAQTFDNQKLEAGIGLVRQRISGAWAERGIAIPAVALDAQRRSVEKAVTDAEAQSVRAQELIRLRELKGMDLIRFEQVNRQQTEALEAARAFLLSTLLPMSRKVSEDQDRITDYKRACMDAYYRYTDTLMAADEAELARLVFERGHNIYHQTEKDQRKLLKYKELAGVLDNEIGTLAQRATAALARLGASVGVDGTERMET